MNPPKLTEAAPPGDTTRRDTRCHPRGLSTLFFTEMWERFSYYGWHLGSSVGNYIGGRLAGFYETMTLPSLSGSVAAFGIGVGIVLLLVSHPLGRLERGH